LGAVGLFGLLRGRTWGVLALGAAGLIPLVMWLLGHHSSGYLLTSPMGYPVVSGQIVQLLAAGLLLVPLVYAAPMLRYLRRR
jgi:hypothetical protein